MKKHQPDTLHRASCSPSLVVTMQSSPSFRRESAESVLMMCPSELQPCRVAWLRSCRDSGAPASRNQIGVKKEAQLNPSMNTVQNYSSRGQGLFCNGMRLNFEHHADVYENQGLGQKHVACPQACTQKMWVTRFAWNRRTTSDIARKMSLKTYCFMSWHCYLSELRLQHLPCMQ